MSIAAGVGLNDHDDAKTAGIEAARAAIAQMGGDAADFVMVFGDVRYDQQTMLDGVTSVVGNVPMIGGSGAGQIGNDGPIQGGVVVMTLRSLREIDVLTGLGKGVGEDPRAAGRSVARQVVDRLPTETLSATWVRTADGFVPIRPYTFVMLPDFAGDGAEVVVGVASEMPPPVQVIGGTTADDLSFNQTFQYHNGRVYSDAVAGALFIAQVPTAVGVAHGWCALGKSMVITRADGSRVVELDGAPAIKAYEELFGVQARELIDEPLGRMALTNPFGIPEITGGYRLRHPISAQEDGSIICAGTMPEGSVVRVMTATIEDNIAAARQATRTALSGLGRAKPALAIVFDCGARMMLRGMEGARREIAAIREEIGPDVPMVGFYTFGEQAPTPGGPVGFHNETCVVYIIGQ